MPARRCTSSLKVFLISLLCCASFVGTAYSSPDPLPQGDSQPPTHASLHTRQPGFGFTDMSNPMPYPAGAPMLLADAAADTKDPPSRGAPSLVHSWETGEGKSYLIPAWEVPAFLTLLNVFDRLAFPHKKKQGKEVYDTSLDSLWQHVSHQNWSFDKDRFDVNQFGHPYEGATMYGLARSAGLNVWQSAIYSNIGSFLWEMGGETSRPSINDLITTGNAGSLLGEAFFRTVNLILEHGGAHPSLWRGLAATIISPPTEFNRVAFGDRFKTAFPSHQPAVFWRLSVGAGQDLHSGDFSDTQEHHDRDGIVAASISYGLPGKTGYTYDRPLDYFDLLISARGRASNLLDALAIRGLLLGADYEAGEAYRGIWGLYGSYDYIGPYLFRVASTAVSLGTTAQFLISPWLTLQGTVLAGYGFGAAGTDTKTPEVRGYHYGGTPQGLLAMNLLFGDRAMLDFTGRAYYVSDVGSDHPVGADLIMQGRAGLTVRLYGRHALGIHYVESFRDTFYHGVPDQDYSEGTISLVYTFLSDTYFGAVRAEGWEK